MTNETKDRIRKALSAKVLEDYQIRSFLWHDEWTRRQDKRDEIRLEAGTFAAEVMG